MPGSAPDALRRIAAQLRELPREIVEDPAKEVVAKGIETVLSANTGGDRSLSHAPGKLKVNVKVKGRGTSVTAEVTAGPKNGVARWSWLEEGTQPHQIGRWTHPGTEGKRTWSSSIEPSLRRVERVSEQKWRRVVR